jgi:DNA invertase Pin-like site-specific DNA recombinase
MKAIILARVSTKEQEEGHSIAAQRQRLIDYCARKGLDVIRTFEIVESSTRGERKEFSAMLDFAKSQEQTIAIVADAVDRFQRSFKESVLIDDLIRREQVELHFYREGMVIGKGASSTDIMRWDFSVMGAKSYVLNLSENVRRSLEYKRRNGEWGGKAPLGVGRQGSAGISEPA